MIVGVKYSRTFPAKIYCDFKGDENFGASIFPSIITSMKVSAYY